MGCSPWTGVSQGPASPATCVHSQQQRASPLKCSPDPKKSKSKSSSILVCPAWAPDGSQERHWPPAGLISASSALDPSWCLECFSIQALELLSQAQLSVPPVPPEGPNCSTKSSLQPQRKAGLLPELTHLHFGQLWWDEMNPNRVYTSLLVHICWMTSRQTQTFWVYFLISLCFPVSLGLVVLLQTLKWSESRERASQGMVCALASI